ncbi:Hypp3221 [Branchiostoma lanceolatum]|uniref:Hypp3221 protein n=1 Tax=Branchiostoma lanceolatum TaxID=7740 RepID=A0A8K0ETP4_BRALA|nr:Hypp3221 [Branchiostoma lanceolatum]
MKFLAVFVLLALSGASSAEPRILDTISGAITEAASSILDHAQTVGQNLVDTYVPIIGQAAQQLVGEAIQNAGTWLTDLVTGKRQIGLQTEVGQILHDGIMSMLEHATNAINNVQESLTSSLTALFTPEPTTKKLAYRKIKNLNLKSRMHLGMDSKSTMKKMSIVIAKKVQTVLRSDAVSLKVVKSARIIDQVVSTLGGLVQPVLDAADQAFQNLVDGATALGSAVVGHATDFANNVGTTFNQVTDQLGAVVQPYVDDANTIINSVTNHFQENFGAGISA